MKSTQCRYIFCIEKSSDTSQCVEIQFIQYTTPDKTNFKNNIFA